MTPFALALLIATATTELALPPTFGSAPRAQEAPDVAWSSSSRTFLVAWREWSARGSVAAARVDAAGKVLDPYGIVVDDDVFKVEPGVRVVACGDVFVLVWASHEGAPVVRARRVDGRGRVLDDKPVKVSPPGVDARAHAVACSERHATITWMVYGTNDIAARMLDVQSGALGTVGVLERGSGGAQTRWPSSLDVAFDGGAFRAVWGLHDGRGGVSWRTARFRVPTDAEAQDIGASTTTTFAMRLAVLPDGGYAVVHRRQGPQGDEGWILSRHRPGQPANDVRIGAQDSGLVDVVADEEGVLVVLQRYVDDPLGPFVVRVHGDAAARGPPLLSLTPLEKPSSLKGCAVCSVRWRVGPAAVAASGERLLAVWPTPVPLEASLQSARPMLPVDVDIQGALLERSTLASSTAEVVPISMGRVLRRVPQAALAEERGLVTWLEGEAAELRASVVDLRARRVVGQPVSLGVVERDRYAVVPTNDGFLVAAAERHGVRLQRLDRDGRPRGQPVFHDEIMTFALAFDGAGPWLARARDKIVEVVRLDDELTVTGEPVRIPTQIRADQVALQCSAPGDCALAFHEEMYGHIRLARVPGLDNVPRYGGPPVVAQGISLQLVALPQRGYALGFVEQRDAKVLRFGKDLKRDGGAQCVSCGVPAGAMEGPGVPAPTPEGALVDVWVDGRRVLHAREGWLSSKKRGRGARPFVVMDRERRLEVWEAGDDVAALLVH